MEALFFIISSAALGYLVQGQEKLKESIFELKQELTEIKWQLPKRKTDERSPKS